MSTVIIAAVVGLLGVGLAVSQLLRLKTWLGRPPTGEPPPTEPSEPPE
jgi:hypothetical protein